MVYTVTLNPALDYHITLPVFLPEQINRAESARLFPGGKGINVSLVLKQLGVSSTALGFVAGFTGEYLQSRLQADGLSTDFTVLKKGLTRINIKLDGERETDINAPGPVIEQPDMELLFEKTDRLKNGDVLVLSGSVPQGLPQEIYACMLQRLTGKGVTFAVDTAGKGLLATLPFHPVLVKPNLSELGELFGVKIREDETALFYAEKLIEMGALNVLLSKGEKGIMLVTGSGEHYSLPAYTGKVVSALGAGDSALAGYLAGLLQGDKPADCLRLANACGAATAFCDGLALRDDIMNLLKQNC